MFQQVNNLGFPFALLDRQRLLVGLEMCCRTFWGSQLVEGSSYVLCPDVLQYVRLQDLDPVRG